MAGPIQFDPQLSGVSQIGKVQAPNATTPAETPEKSFRDVLMDSLDQVDRLQQEATAGVERFMTGETSNVAEVFTAVKKAGVAFDLLMEIRNKLMSAYDEIKQMRS